MIKANFSRREKIFAFLAIGAGLFFMAYTFILRPMFSKLAAQEEEIGSGDLQWKKSLKILSQEQSITRQYQPYSEILKLKGSDEQEMARVLSEVEAVAKGINIRVLDMKPKKVKSLDLYKSFSVDLVVEGAVRDISRFMLELQSPPRLIKVEKFRLQKESSAQPALKAFLVVSKVLFL